MANPEHLGLLKQGVVDWYRWRKENPNIIPDLSEANLSGYDLKGYNLRRANLLGVNFQGADLCEAYLNHSNLFASDFSTAVLAKSGFRRAYLRGVLFREAVLVEADLTYCDLTNVVLSGANLEGASVGFTSFCNTNLHEVMGLKEILHVGPSTIGIDTLYKSKGNIPEAFFRGCGVPDQMIEYARSLTASPIQYYSCFISYSSKDEEFASRVHNDLQAAGVRCWFAPHDIQAGKKIHHQIDEAIRIHEKLLLILSPSSMESNWVGSEIIRAKKKEDSQDSQMLFPVSIVPYEKIQDWEFFDSDTGRDLAREIRAYFIPDFSLWKKDHDAYPKAFDHLLRDLKAG